MDLKLAENIRTLRKERKMTQEQLAEVLGVTTGAVYKWESGLSIPELPMLMDMADFFDTSVDVLIGYKVRDNHVAAVIKRISEYCRSMNPEAVTEAEKLLRKYPNSFDAVYTGANVFLVFGAENHDISYSQRALQLLEQARLLVDQNTDPHISEQTLYGDMAVAYYAMDEPEKGMELLKAHNAGGIHSDSIGVTLSLLLHRTEEAEPFLTEALLNGVNTFLTAIGGFVCLFLSRNQAKAANDLIEVGLTLMRGLKDGELSDYTDKLFAEMLTLHAVAEIHSGLPEAARQSLLAAKATADRFDANPDYGMDTLRFVTLPKEYNAHDLLGATAFESIETIIRYLDDRTLTELWNEVKKDE
ncbi:MAG: helix-turn-helix transcriptional regulator [Lachnospiraceae bacterium]|nr:helix-turn-helix transcriptional regulator [Lachnospiraceae bacterium]